MLRFIKGYIVIFIIYITTIAAIFSGNVSAIAPLVGGVAKEALFITIIWCVLRNAPIGRR